MFASFEISQVFFLDGVIVILECNKREKRTFVVLSVWCLFYETVVSLLGVGCNLDNSQLAIVSSPALYAFSILFSLQL